MKQALSFLLCLCLMLAVLPPAFTAYAEEGDPPQEAAAETDVVDVEETAADTIYEDPDEEEPSQEEEPPQEEEAPDEEAPLPEEEEEPPQEEEATEPLPEEELPPVPEEEIYDELSFDAENAEQLEHEYVLDEIIVKFKSPSEVPGKEKQLRDEIQKLQKVGFVESLGVYVVKADDLTQDPNAVLNRFKNNKFIEYIEPNYIATLDYVPNDPSFKVYQSRALELIGGTAGWDIITGSDRVKIAVIDSGVVAHSDLPKARSGYASVSGLAYANDRVGHGTNVAGVIGGIGDNALGGAGINWDAYLIPVKVDDAGGTASVSNIAKGITWAADNGARVLNLSLGVAVDSVTLRNAINYAYNKGCVIVAAAGNDGKSTVTYPARYDNVLAVGATTNATTPTSYSNYGPGINVMASGTYYTTSASGRFSNATGTSFAAPQVTALASLILAIDPGLSNDEVYRLIEQGARGNGSYIGDEMGYGCINIGKTLQMAVDGAGGGGWQEPEPESAPEYFDNPVIQLAGFGEITLTVGESYQEAGYSAADCLGNDLTDEVVVTNHVDTAAQGLYTVAYEVTDAGGNTASTVRTVIVNPAPAEPEPEVKSPTITIIGSNPIILHLGSGTPYTEQGARAIDTDGKNISDQVEVIGAPDREKAGTYTITYKIVGKDGGEATATRDVRILAPDSEKIFRTPYGFSGQGKQGAKITHTGIVAGTSGYMDLKVKSIDKNMTISVQIINSATGQAVTKDTYTATGTKQYWLDEGKYELSVTVDKCNGNSKYAIDLLMPEVVTFTFEDQEIPLIELPWEEAPADASVTNQLRYVVLAVLALALIAAFVLHRRRRGKANSH